MRRQCRTTTTITKRLALYVNIKKALEKSGAFFYWEKWADSPKNGEGNCSPFLVVGVDAVLLLKVCWRKKSKHQPQACQFLSAI
jgi:hypothetical protein